MLDKSFKPTTPPSLGFDLRLLTEQSWANARHRLLIILQSVDGADLKRGQLGSTPSLRNAIKYARQHARRYNRDLPEFSFTVINFNDRKHLHLSGAARVEAESEFKVRTLKLIKMLKPTHILFSGDLNLLYPMPNAELKNGWVHEIDGRKVVSTLDMGRLLEKQGLHANLLGFWCRHLGNLMLGYLPHSLAGLENKPVLINTVERFDKVMALWDKAKIAATDTETRNLSGLKNAIYTIQFAFDDNPNRGFVIPVDHPHARNPFEEEARKYMKREMKMRFGAASGPELVTFNGTFDLRVIRRALKLDIIQLPVWEITAGEHLLDENISDMKNLGIKMGGLAAQLCSYGNDSYVSGDMAFSKAERSTTGQVDPSDPHFLEYASLDVVSIINMREKQIERAGYQDLNEKNYRPYFVRHMQYQMSDTVHQLSHLKEAGSLIDKQYLKSLMAPDSPLVKAIAEASDEFRAFPQVREANAQLLAESGFKTGSLFGKAAGSQWVFSLTKPLHKAKLFLEVLGLTAISKTTTGQPQLDNKFVEHYRDRNFVVDLFGEYQEAAKLLSTYVKSWYYTLTREVDGAADSHMRSDFGFFDVDTGRLGSSKPNLQNIPTRGKLSKIIKEMFITCDGHLLIRFDYSAHEVRGWSIVARDTVLAAAFKAGQALRQQLIKNPTDEIRKELKTKGDLHIQNDKRFLNKWVEKSDPLRDAIKSIVFGVLYGKSAKTLGHDTKRAEINDVKEKINVAHKAGNKAELRRLEGVFERLLEEDRTDYAQNIIDKMFKEFERGHRWVLKMQEMATTKFYVFSPIGRIRHLYAAMTEDRQIVGRQVRRGMNAPIQGFASEIAVKSSRLILMSYYRNQKKLCKLLGLEGRYRVKFNRAVHDASYFTVPFEMVIPFIHILQYEATYGITRLYDEQFGLKFTVEPEIELEVGVKDTKSHKWGWELPELIKHIETAVDEGIEGKFYTQSKEEIMGLILAPWKNKATLAMLDEKWPLLDVHLTKEISDAVRGKY